MKLGPVTKFHKRNKTSKKIDGDVMSENCAVIVIFFNLWPIWSDPEAGGHIACKIYVFIDNNLLYYKN